MAVMATDSGVRGAAGILLRLVGYYLLVAAVLALTVWVFPGFAEMLSLDFRTGVEPAVGFARDAIEAPRALSSGLSPVVNTVLLGTLAMLGGLIFAMPVAWTYTETKRDEGFDKSIVQMIVMLPLAVGGVVLLVRGQIAIAFALAGIVAAVRFRTTFKDVKDAVFAFVAIGIGLASGMQAWLLAGVLSFVFCVVVVALWRFELGEGSDRARREGPLTLSEALARDDPERAIVVGDPVLVGPLNDDEMRAVKEQASRLEQHVRADAFREKQKYKHVMLVYAVDAEEAEERVEDLLEKYAKRWRMVEVLPGRDGIQILEYLVRFKKSAELGELLDRLQATDEEELVRAVELKSMKGLRG